MNNTWWEATKLLTAPKSKRITGITLNDYGTIYFVSSSGLYEWKDDTKLNCLVEFKVISGGLTWFNNNLYICNWGNHKILNYSTYDGNLSTLAGTGIQGLLDGNFKEAQFSFPWGITNDKKGALYVTQDHCIRKLNLESETAETISGGNFRGYRDGDAKSALFDVPKGIDITDDGVIYVCDYYNHSIRKIKDGIVSAVVGSGRGSTLFPPKDGKISFPQNLVVYNDSVLVTTGSAQEPNSIQKILDHETETLNLPQIQRPFSIAKNSQGHIFVGSTEESQQSKQLSYGSWFLSRLGNGKDFCGWGC